MAALGCPVVPEVKAIEIAERDDPPGQMRRHRRAAVQPLHVMRALGPWRPRSKSGRKTVSQEPQHVATHHLGDIIRREAAIEQCLRDPDELAGVEPGRHRAIEIGAKADMVDADHIDHPAWNDGIAAKRFPKAASESAVGTLCTITTRCCGPKL